MMQTGFLLAHRDVAFQNLPRCSCGLCFLPNFRTDKIGIGEGLGRGRLYTGQKTNTVLKEKKKEKKRMKTKTKIFE